MSAPELVKALIHEFTQNIQELKSPLYDEAKVRRDYVDPFWEALGWDVHNQQRRSEVVFEDRVTIDGRVKHPDYAFLTGRQRRFFVETKKPAVNLRENPEPAFQVRRYGWSAKLPVSVLTDFEEFAIYDCRVQPDHNDQPHVGRLKLYRYQEYADRWDEIAELFHYEAVQSNRLEELVQAVKHKGTMTVDNAFLREMEQWRVMLAQDIALLNRGLTQRQINMAVQTTIDRIVFLRICEDRGIEGYGRLYGYANGRSVYANLTQLFRQADEKYNSGLFHFKIERGREEPDQLTLTLAISDDTLQTIINRLYYPNSPYEFSVLPADILGQVYERFLGKVIELTPSGGATVTEKPEVRKAGGVYYTPTYIVDYIVQNTVGKLVEGKTPDEVARLRILDPACGSGSFLIGTFEYLLNWHRDWYAAHNAAQHVKTERVRQLDDGGYALTTQEKRRILLNNLYGVDLDQQAVEVTKLSLLLKVLEGETAQTAQPRLMTERVLPDLDNNIKWGNSLIGPDFYTGKQMGLFGDEDLYKVKVFDWHSPTDGFGAIMAAGGFDAVIGNPPYIRIQTMLEWAPESVEFYKRRYVAASKGNYDIYVIFVERALQLLNANGLMGYILPHKFFNAKYGEPLRGLLAQGKHLEQVVHFGDQQIFDGATTYTCLLFLGKTPQPQFEFVKVEDVPAWQSSSQVASGHIPNEGLNSKEWNFGVGKSARLFEKLRAMPMKLGNVAHIFVGTQTSADDVFVLDRCRNEENCIIGFSEALGREVRVEQSCTRPFLRGKEIRKYETLSGTSRLICPYEIGLTAYRLFSFQEMQAGFPLTLAYLEATREKLESRERGKFRNENWYAYGYPKSMILFEKPKIVVPDYNNAPSFTYDTKGHFYKTGYGIILNDGFQSPLYILSLLNSRLLFRYLLSIGTTLRGGYVRFWTQYIEQLPIRTINFDNPADKARHDRMVILSETMLDLHRQLGAATSEAAKKTLHGVIASTDREIDVLVYELYGLTPEEIRIVEGEASQ